MKTILTLFLFTSSALATPQDIVPTIKSTSNAIDAYTGLGMARDDEQNRLAADLITKTKREGGIVIIETWIWKGRGQIAAMRRNPDGSWSGPIPAMGYYTCPRHQQLVTYPKH